MRLDVRKVVGRATTQPLVRHDAPASLVVFLVAVPLSLGIAAASEAPLTAGLVAAAVGGIVAGLLGGSSLQVSGPAVGLTVIVAGLVSQFGWRATCALTVAAGLVQVALGLSRVAHVALAVSPTVVHGMLAGIGLTIALGQLHLLLGAQPAARPLDNVTRLPAHLGAAQGAAVLAGVSVVGVLVAWPRRAGRLRVVPAPLVAVVGVTALVELGRLDVARVDLPAQSVTAVQLPSLPAGNWSAMVVAVLTLAVVASVESLASAAAVDTMRPEQRTAYDRELVGQGAANAVSGLLGGLPVTGVIARSSTNVLAGARSRASAVLHGVWVLVLSLFAVGLVERIPLAVLAGILVAVGFQLIKPVHWRAARSHGEGPVYVATAAGVVAFGLLEGVLLGIGLSVLLVVRRVVRARVRVERHCHPTPTPHPQWTVVAEGSLSFLSVPRLSRKLAEIPAGSVVALHLLVDFLDHAVSDHLRAWKHQHEAGGGIVVVDEMALAPRSTR